MGNYTKKEQATYRSRHHHEYYIYTRRGGSETCQDICSILEGMSKGKKGCQPLSQRQRMYRSIFESYHVNVQDFMSYSTQGCGSKCLFQWWRRRRHVYSAIECCLEKFHIMYWKSTWKNHLVKNKLSSSIFTIEIKKCNEKVTSWLLINL